MYQKDEVSAHLNYGDFVITSHLRLADMKISRVFVYSIKSEDTIDSNHSPIEPYILLVPPSLIGVHESTIGDPTRPQYVPPGHDNSGFTGIDLSTGWHGPAVAVAAQTPEIYENITTVLKNKGGLGMLSEIDYGTLVTLDGHHRLEMAIALNLAYIPVQIIPFPHKNVVIGTWRDDGYIWAPDTVLECGKIPKWKAPEKRTKFQVKGKDNVLRRIRNIQPCVDIPLSSLIT